MLQQLIEVGVVNNKAVSARAIQQDTGGIEGVGTAYGVYVLADRAVRPQRRSSKHAGARESADNGAALR